MGNNRTSNSLKNTTVSLIVQVSVILLSFIGRTVFIKQLNIEYLGVNGLFSNILTLLSLAELGVGTAITYMMYKPIAEKDIEKVAAFNNLFRKVYNCIGLFILVVGLSLTPFIPHLIKGTPDISENIHIIYVLYLLNVSVSYFFTYKRSLLIAYQKEYVNNKNVLQFTLLKEVLLIAILFTLKSFYVYLATQVLVTILSNFAISYKTNRLLPEVVRVRPAKVPKSEIRVIVKNTMAMVCSKIGSVVATGTGNMFISYYVGIAVVGIYSNYILISSSVCSIIIKAINSVTASFGNLVATSDSNRVYDVFKKMYFMNFALAYVCAMFYYALIDPFISIWIGSEYFLDKLSILILVVNYIFFNIVRIPSQMVINTCGLFWQIKWKSIVEAGINLALSFLFTAYLGFGIQGILMSLLLSNIATNLWWEPYVAFKYGIKMPLRMYMKEFMKNVAIVAISLAVISASVLVIDAQAENIIVNIILRIVIVAILIFATSLFYRRTSEYTYVLNLVRSIAKPHKQQ